MSRAIGRSVAAALLAALLGAAWAAVLYAWHPVLRIEFDRDLPRSVTGVYPPERDDASQLTFAWTAQEAVVRLPALDRGADWTLDLRVRGARQVAADNPQLAVLVDGVIVGTSETSADWRDVRIVIPARPARRGLQLALRSSATFVPGPADPRPLGVMLDRLSLTPGAVVLVPRPVLDATAVSSAAMGAAIAVLGVTAGSAIGAAALLSAGTAAIVSRGFGPFTDYPGTVIRLGLWMAAALAGMALAVQYRRKQPLRNTARFAVAFSASALFLKLIVLLHPDMPIGDAMFHAHRFQGVLGGNLYFTSIAPGGYAFPYPPGLYVFASAFAGLVRRGVGDVALLRIITSAIDAAAGLLLYGIVVSAWRDRLAAAMAVALYHLIPLAFAVLTTGNLTNAFAQSIAIAALALMGAGRVRLETWPATAMLAAVLAIAYLSHTSTFAIVFVATLATAALFAARGGAALQRTAVSIVVATAVAALLAVVLYYAHFMGTYRAEFARIGKETATAASDAGGRGIGERLGAVPYALRTYLGIPALLFAALGARKLMRARAGDRLTLALGGWTASCLLFLLLGVLTPVDMRYYLAAIPVLAIAAGFGAARAWSAGAAGHRTLWRAAAAIGLAAMISAGVRDWWSTLG